MAIQNHITTLRLDATTLEILQCLVRDLDLNNSQLIRRSIRLLMDLTEIKKQHGEILIHTKKGGKVLILLS